MARPRSRPRGQPALPPTASALRALRAWQALDAAFEGYDRYLNERFGITGAQLEMLRIVGERQPVTLADLRAHLAAHPATLGQLVARLARRRLVSVAPDVADRRRRLVELTPGGRRILRQAPLAGPIRLRSLRSSDPRIAAAAEALSDALELFGLRRWAPRSREPRAEARGPAQRGGRKARGST